MESSERWLFRVAFLCHSALLFAQGNVIQQVVEGHVGAGNYSYYTLEKAGDVDLALTSLEGDADLYVSTLTKAPTFLLHEHQFQAVSCGLDTLHLPASLGRPLTIGVYGHPSAPNSTFRLAISLRPSPSSPAYSAEEAEEPRRSDESPPLGGDGDEEEGLGGFWGALGSVLLFVLEILVEVLT